MKHIYLHWCKIRFSLQKFAMKFSRAVDVSKIATHSAILHIATYIIKEQKYPIFSEYRNTNQP